jgi:hypothetical protein
MERALNISMAVSWVVLVGELGMGRVGFVNWVEGIGFLVIEGAGISWEFGVFLEIVIAVSSSRTAA